MDEKTKTQIIALINRSVLPAVGCTEPAAVSLAAAAAADLLGEIPEKIDVYLSANVLKNAMGVGIPGTGMIGLPIAIALGALIAKPACGLEILKEITPDLLEKGKSFIGKKALGIHLKDEVDKLYIEARVSAGKHSSACIIAGSHTRFVYKEKNGNVLLDKRQPVADGCEEGDDVSLSFDLVYRFAMETPVEEIRFIKETTVFNRAASDASLGGSYGHMVGKIISGEQGRKYMGENPFSHMLAMTAAACDARMGGAMIPVMSNSGSGNQGIAATLPVLSIAEDTGASEEQLIRALVLSHLMLIYIKQSLGCLSALCGCVVAATGATSGITYLMGGTKEQITFAIKNMIGNITGMICDGAKPGCALKISGGVSTAMLSAMMAMENKVVTGMEGIIDDDVDRSILNLTRIGSVGMEVTDKLVLEIMTGK